MQKNLWILFLVVFIDLVGVGVFAPIFPELVPEHGGNTLILGLLTALYALFQFIFSPILGRLSDKYGRKNILIISSLVTSLSYLLLIFSQNIWVIALGRALGGIGGSNISVVQAYIADISEGHERTRLLSIYAAVFSTGFIVGPVIGSLLSSYISLIAPFYFIFVLALFNSIFIARFIKESNSTLQKRIKIEFINLEVTRELMKPKNMAFLFSLLFLVNFAFALTIGVFPVYAKEFFNWGEAEIGYYFAYTAFIAFSVQAFGMQKTLQYISEMKLIRYGIIVYALSCMAFGFFHTVPQILLISLFAGLGFSAINPTIQSIISLESTADEQGAALGVAQAIGAFARILGPIIGGILALYSVNLPYIAAGLTALVTIIWSKKYLSESFLGTSIPALSPTKD